MEQFFPRRASTRFFIQLGLTLLTLPFVAPLYGLIAGSSRGQGFIANYTAVLSQPLVGKFFLNSILISLIVIFLSLIAALSAGFALSKLKVPLKGAIFSALIVALAIPTVSLIVPLFFTVRALGIFDNPLAVALPVAALTTSFNVLLVRSFMNEIPDEIIEAGRLDGAGNMRILIQIVGPLSLPIIAVVAVWSFVGAWNEFLLPLLFLQSSEQQTVTLLPSFFASRYTGDITKIMAASTLVAIPLLLLYLSLQRLFEKGLTGGAIK